MTVTKTSLGQQTITDQVDEQSESQQLDGICSTNIAILDPLQVCVFDCQNCLKWKNQSNFIAFTKCIKI